MAISRPVLLTLALSIPSLAILEEVAEAGRDGGGSSGGGGGRLGQVSSGLASATASGGSNGGGSSSPAVTVWDPQREPYTRAEHAEPVIFLDPGVPVVRRPEPPSDVTVDFYAGAQKVYDSDGSLSAELAFNEGRFRLGGSISRYFERQPDRDALTLTLGALYVGFRIDDGGPTRAYLEFGAVGARTHNDPVMDSSVGGLLGGALMEHRVSRGLTVLAEAQVMGFEHDVRAGALRAGVRHGHLQASLRYVDFNVGPSLFGPEVGLSF